MTSRNEAIRYIAALLGAFCCTAGLSCAGSGGGGGAEEDVNVCEAWAVWGPADKNRFLDPIWFQAIGAVRTPLMNAGATPEQIEAYNRCFEDTRPEFIQDMDRVCAEPGANIDSGEMAGMASSRVPRCMEKAGIG